VPQTSGSKPVPWTVLPAAEPAKSASATPAAAVSVPAAATSQSQSPRTGGKGWTASKKNAGKP
ncbi:MAG: ABC transporter substrate-binding protein, partial [Planctomycetaceae bacterium]